MFERNRNTKAIRASHTTSHLTCSILIGSFGRVLLAKNKKTGEFFAMKRLKKADIIKLRQVDHVISENTILADIDHPFLVSSPSLLINSIYSRLASKVSLRMLDIFTS